MKNGFRLKALKATIKTIAVAVASVVISSAVAITVVTYPVFFIVSLYTNKNINFWDIAMPRFWNATKKLDWVFED